MKGLLRRLAQIVPAILALALLAFVLRRADLARALALVDSFGWWLPLLLVPNLLAVLSESLGWWSTLARLGPRPRFRALFGVRLSIDALQFGLPSGAIVSESMAPVLLHQRCALSPEAAIVATVGRRFVVIFAHGVFLLASTLLAWPALASASRTALGGPGLPWLLLAVGLALVATASLTAAATGQGRIGARLHARLERLGGRWLTSWLEHHAARFRETDERLTLFFRRPLGFSPAVALFLAGWLMRSLETLVFLRALGVAISPSLAMAIEGVLVLVRALAVPVPAGLGVQDVGYVLALRALALPDAVTVGTAFVLLKRGKDLAYILLGFLLLLAGGRRTRLSPAPAAIQARPA